MEDVQTLKNRLAIIGVPLCDGERELGVERAPDAIRAAGLLTALGNTRYRDLGNVALETPVPDKLSGKVRNSEQVLDACRMVKEAVADVLREDDFPLLLGGDCSLLLGSLGAVTKRYGRVGVLYVDGHADFHTAETTISGYYSGMVLALAVGRGGGELRRIGNGLPIVKEEDVAVVGANEANFDPGELADVKASHVHLYTSDALRRDGIYGTVRKAVESIPRPMYLHFDLDVVAATEMPALAGFKAGVHHPGGLSLKEAGSLCEALSRQPLVAMDVTLFDPNRDPNKIHARAVVNIIRDILAPKVGRQ